MEKCLGKCACGEIEFECVGDPINSVFCYCPSCQSLTNSDKWFGFWYPKGSVSFTKGKPSIFIRKGDSGKNMEHIFCSECSTTVAAFCEIGNFYSIAASCLQNKKTFSQTCLYIPPKQSAGHSFQKMYQNLTYCPLKWVVKSLTNSCSGKLKLRLFFR